MSVNTLRNPAQKIVIQKTSGNWWITCPTCNYKHHFNTCIHACLELVAHIQAEHPLVLAEYNKEIQAINQLVLELGAEEVK